MAKRYKRRTVAMWNVGARCPNCDGPIEQGDLIEHDKREDPWQHVDCDTAIYMTADVDEEAA